MSEVKTEQVKIPQIEIDGQKYHESATISFSYRSYVKVTGDTPETQERKTIFSCYKQVIVRDRVVTETLLREDEDKQLVFWELKLHLDDLVRGQINNTRSPQFLKQD